MNNSLAKVPSANTDYKITAGPIETTSYFIVRSLLEGLVNLTVLQVQFLQDVRGQMKMSMLGT